MKFTIRYLAGSKELYDDFINNASFSFFKSCTVMSSDILNLQKPFMKFTIRYLAGSNI